MKPSQTVVYLRDAVLDIIKSVGSVDNLLEDQGAQELIRSIEDQLDLMGTTLRQELPVQIVASYFGSADDATGRLVRLGVDVPPTLSITPKGTIARSFQKPIHLEAVQYLSQRGTSRLNAAIRTAKQSSGMAIEETLAEVKKELVNKQITGSTNRAVAKRVAEKLQNGGLTAATSIDGKQIPIDVYASTVVRTETMEASTQGSVNRYKDGGTTVVQISEHFPTCHVCAAYQGMLISLTGEHEGLPYVEDEGVELPPFHPNCAHVCLPVPELLYEDEEIKEAWEKSKRFNPNIDNRGKKEKELYKTEQQMRGKARQEAKEYARIVATLGKDAPKTLGAFRRIKHANSKPWKDLQNKYKNLTQ